MEEPKTLTYAERGRLGGLKAANQSSAGKLGGKISRGGGRPPKYASEAERAEAKRASALASYHRRKYLTVRKPGGSRP